MGLCELRPALLAPEDAQGVITVLLERLAGLLGCS